MMSFPLMLSSFQNDVQVRGATCQNCARAARESHVLARNLCESGFQAASETGVLYRIRKREGDRNFQNHRTIETPEATFTSSGLPYARVV